MYQIPITCNLFQTAEKHNEGIKLTFHLSRSRTLLDNLDQQGSRARILKEKQTYSFHNSSFQKFFPKISVPKSSVMRFTFAFSLWCFDQWRLLQTATEYIKTKSHFISWVPVNYEIWHFWFDYFLEVILPSDIWGISQIFPSGFIKVSR